MPGKKEKQPLSVTHPELAKEADGWDTGSVTKGSHKKLSWICSNGHHWKAVVKDRASGKGCQKCYFDSPRKFTSLVSKNPVLAKQAFGWNPKDFGIASNKKMAWRCEFGHTWEATIRSRSSSRGCPYCSNNKVWPGFNDIATTHPEISKTLHNANPEAIIAGSEKKFEWKCSLGHIFELKVKERIGRNYGCPYCSNSKVLKGFNDFETKHPELAKEADGWDPSTVIGGSAVSKNWLCSEGHKYRAKVSSRDASNSGCPYCAKQLVLKGFNDLATTHPELAAQADGWDPAKIISKKTSVNWICPNGHKTKASIATRKSGSGCRVCVNQEVLAGYNDLQTKFPELAAEAYGWDPSKVSPGSSKSMTWICSKGHNWKSVVVSRSSLGAGCPYCSNTKVLTGFNDLVTTHPEIAKQASGWDPSKITFGSNSKKLWECQYGHKWTISPTVRTSKGGSGCPSCAETGFDPNSDGYLYFLIHPRWEMFQIGITNVPDNRLSKHSRLGWELLELRGPMDGHLTQQWETAILRMLKAKGADLSNSKIAGKFDGYSEAWTKSTFEVKSIKELMKLTEEFEEETSKKLD